MESKPKPIRRKKQSLSHIKIVVLSYLLRNRMDGHVKVRITDMSNAIDSPAASVMNALKELEAEGAIVIERNRKKGNIYKLTPDAEVMLTHLIETAASLETAKSEKPLSKHKRSSIKTETGTHQAKREVIIKKVAKTIGEVTGIGLAERYLEGKQVEKLTSIRKEIRKMLRDVEVKNGVSNPAYNQLKEVSNALDKLWPPRIGPNSTLREGQKGRSDTGHNY